MLDERLSSSCFVLGNWPLSTVLLKNDQNIPWFLLVPRVNNVEEIYHLESHEQIMLMQEINHLSLLVKKHYQPEKINIAALGNIVRQLHVHCVARTSNDPFWPQGIWQSCYQSKAYSEEQLQLLLPILKNLVSDEIKN